VSRPELDPSPWSNSSPDDPEPGGDEFAGFIVALRTLLDDVTAARAPVDVWADAAQRVTQLDELLAAYRVPESEQIVGNRHDLPGRGQVLAPAVHVDEVDASHVAARVTFGRHFVGNGAVHGGALPLVFDEILGRLANTAGRSRSRTAYLRVNYRSLTPIDVELTLTGRFVREEGRKRFLVAELREGDRLCADAEGLFVALRTGQR
jgi:acyl-coenzyme A thioesterase PaaI-like protein